MGEMFRRPDGPVEREVRDPRADSSTRLPEGADEAENGYVGVRRTRSFIDLSFVSAARVNARESLSQDGAFAR